METSTWAAIIVIGAIIWTIYLTIKVWVRLNWAWAILCLVACCTITPLGVYFLIKLLDPFGGL